MSQEHANWEDGAQSAPDAERQSEVLDQEQLQEIFRMLTEFHLALHMTMDFDRERMEKEMEHAMRLREEKRIEEQQDAREISHRIAA